MSWHHTLGQYQTLHSIMGSVSSRRRVAPCTRPAPGIAHHQKQVQYRGSYSTIRDVSTTARVGR
eukprot:2007821-Rhodomonas_salina.2